MSLQNLVRFRFQFPTGWNSTNTRFLFMDRYEACFNSQRDGILLKYPGTIARNLEVSIPNGMEFYSTLLDCVSTEVGFNSQRDGILRAKSAFKFPSLSPFQFPTGWNSTEITQNLLFLKKVSIPNGMEFYVPIFSALLRLVSFQFPMGWNSTRLEPERNEELKRFNSQRDGILHNSCVAYYRIRQFQFPTGWNSTQAIFVLQTP
ncbi:hypothetical protein [uncultured Campylobacter sp.]|uniref:hypothetical protein n=1 Tax=uncultured Campylobacter sp. TaxID=218934 RepID=UPI0025F5EA39|nr:hypothetical protein [uncultured Campylobacter sp.]